MKKLLIFLTLIILLSIAHPGLAQNNKLIITENVNALKKDENLQRQIHLEQLKEMIKTNKTDRRLPFEIGSKIKWKDSKYNITKDFAVLKISDFKDEKGKTVIKYGALVSFKVNPNKTSSTNQNQTAKKVIKQPSIFSFKLFGSLANLLKSKSVSAATLKSKSASDGYSNDFYQYHYFEFYDKGNGYIKFYYMRSWWERNDFNYEAVSAVQYARQYGRLETGGMGTCEEKWNIGTPNWQGPDYSQTYKYSNYIEGGNCAYLGKSPGNYGTSITSDVYYGRYLILDDWATIIKDF